MGVIEDLLAANERYAGEFPHCSLAAPPALHLAIITCMDARVNPEGFLGLTLGDAHIIRNAGGRVTEDVIRSLVISSRLLGVREFMVIHHTDCGLMKSTDDEIRERLQRETGADVPIREFHTFRDLGDSVRQDVGIIRSTSLILGGHRAAGLIYHVDSGRLEAVNI